MVWRREAEIGTISPLARNRDTIRNRMAEVGEVFSPRRPDGRGAGRSPGDNGSAFFSCLSLRPKSAMAEILVLDFCELPDAGNGGRVFAFAPLAAALADPMPAAAWAKKGKSEKADSL